MPRAIALRIRVSAKQYADAARQLRDGNLNANPLAQALAEQGTYRVSGFTPVRITVIEIATGRRYSGFIPAVVRDYVAGFQSGGHDPADHEFELALESRDEWK